jgi:hypothetical protein
MSEKEFMIFPFLGKRRVLGSGHSGTVKAAQIARRLCWQ